MAGYSIQQCHSYSGSRKHQIVHCQDSRNIPQVVAHSSEKYKDRYKQGLQWLGLWWVVWAALVLQGCISQYHICQGSRSCYKECLLPLFYNPLMVLRKSGRRKSKQ
jgi:hypothetical protein